MKRPFVYTPEDINKEFDDLWKSLRRNRSADVSSVDIGAELAPDTVRHNTIQFNDNGDIWYVDREGNETLLSGGGADTNFFTTDLVLASEREHQLDGNRFSIRQNGENFLHLDGGAGDEQAYIRAFNDTGSGNQGFIQALGGNAFGQVTLQGSYNDDANLASIQLIASALNSQVLSSANEYQSTFTTTVAFTSAGDDWLRLDVSSLQSQLKAADGTAESEIFFEADSVGGDITFRIKADDGANPAVQIDGDAVTNTITYAALHHNFAGLQDFADDAAAAVGGLNVGDLYRTASVVKVRVA